MGRANERNVSWAFPFGEGCNPGSVGVRRKGGLCKAGI